MIIHKINFPIYIIIVLLAIIVGLCFVSYSVKKEAKCNNNILLFFFLSFVLMVSWGKLFTYLFIDNDFIESGLTSFGCAAGLMASTIIFEKIMPLKGKLFKYVCISLPLIYGLAKIACFMVGCCHGIPYDGIFSVTYVDYKNIAVFPIQIVETITFLIIFIVVYKNRNNKYISYITIMVSAFAKFILDFLRYEHVKEIISFNQIICLLVMIIVTVMLFYDKKRVNLKD